MITLLLTKYRSYLIGIGLLVALAFLVIANIQNQGNNSKNLTFLLIVVAGIIIMISNDLITRLLDKQLSWSKYKLTRFIIQVLAGLIVSLFWINVSYYVLKGIYTDSPPDLLQLISINILSAAIIIPIIAIFFGIKFLRAWNLSQLESERLQKENARSQMMSLRNHLDPHFLFNNLNILSSLIDHDADLSKKYLEKFAEVYRTILKSELSDLTLLGEEMKLVEAYIYLIQIRWRDALKVSIDINPDYHEKALPPLSLQMLLENVVKHNTLTAAKPVEITISAKSDYLSVVNTKRLKAYDPSNTSGTGLQNIQNRYEYFTEKKVDIINDENTFEVRLPLLTIE